MEDLSITITNISDRQDEIAYKLGKLHKFGNHNSTVNDKYKKKVENLLTRCEQSTEEFGLFVSKDFSNTFRGILKVALKRPGATRNAPAKLYPKLEKAVAAYTDALSTEHSKITAELKRVSAEHNC